MVYRTDDLILMVIQIILEFYGFYFIIVLISNFGGMLGLGGWGLQVLLLRIYLLIVRFCFKFTFCI